MKTYDIPVLCGYSVFGADLTGTGERITRRHGGAEMREDLIVKAVDDMMVEIRWERGAELVGRVGYGASR